ncbi:endonuclease [Haemophilus paracuniculus]|uniref:Endonuclease n=1 Tax=Haemophilus paracuniculus TaxID=734 RepID=A0A1T0ASN7_9PAST|nr:endonuclease [Haemophilus paracuniculus]OOR99301.1 endonuclease [Haemophilus paracuniculus]
MSIYARIIEGIFFDKYKQGDIRIEFLREDIIEKANVLNIKLPKNLGDVIYSFKFRNELPKSIKETSIGNKEWVIKSIGKSVYCFELVEYARVIPDKLLHTISIPDSTPQIVKEFSLNDEQALLTKIRYNRLIDLFSEVVCYSLQNHLRTFIPNVGQIETDEIYIGIDKKGNKYVFPVQAKGGTDEIGIVQIEQDFLLCEHKYSNLICIPIAVQFIDSDKIAMFSFIRENGLIRKLEEKHYLLVCQDNP